MKESKELKFTSIDDIPKVVDELRKTFLSGQSIPLSRRKFILKKIYHLCIDMEKEICDALWMDLHKDYKSAVGTEIFIPKNDIVEALEKLDDWVSNQKAETNSIVNAFDRCEVHYQPYGVVCIISPWNYPFLLIMSPVIAAIAAGNVVLMKPSEVSSNTALLLEKFIRELNVDEIKLINGGAKETAVLLDQRFDKIFYTGSGKIARIVMKAASKNLTPVALELGGKCPVVISENSDIETAAKRIWWAKCLNAGQTCIAPDYVLCPKKLVKPFIQGCVKAHEQFFGSQVANCEHFCRIINKTHFKRISELLNKQLNVKGSVLEFGGETNEENLFIAPTIVSGVGKDPEANPLMSEEIFGPVLPIVAIESLDEAVQCINSKDKPLSLYVFSKDEKCYERILNATSSGGVVVNDLMVNMLVSGLPFGGVGESGMDAYHGKFGFECFSHKRSVMIRPHGLEFMNKPRYFPLNDGTFTITRKLLEKKLPGKFSLWIASFLKGKNNKLLSWLLTLVCAFLLGYYTSHEVPQFFEIIFGRFKFLSELPLSSYFS